MARTNVLVAGGGMAGLGAALALARARPDLQLTLLEQADAFGEVGAGIQLGPNAVHVLRDWGLEPDVRECAAFPERLVVRDVADGGVLGRLALGQRAVQHYGAPYATIHRADLHELLQRAVGQVAAVKVELGQQVHDLHTAGDGSIVVSGVDGHSWTADAVLGCDGVWSRVRAVAWRDAPARFTGHLAYRGMVPMGDLPAAARRQEVSVWLGPRCHVVHYPVRSGTWMNVVAVVHGDLPAEGTHWNHQAHAADLQQALGAVATPLQDVLQRVLQWRLWPLHARPPMRSAAEQVQGAVALLGDAAHPMRPYLAQGAAMALEDAWVLGRELQGTAASVDWPDTFTRWVAQRWARNAWVQDRSRRNGVIFHAQGPMRWGRNLAMAALGERLLDVPRLYRGPANPA